MIDIDTLIEEAKANEAKVIYDAHKVSCQCPVPADCECEDSWDTLTLLNGGSAKAVVSGKTLTLYYSDGTTSTYTEA